MKWHATRLILATFCITMLVGAAASADPTTDRLFVLVSPPDVAGPSSIVAFDIGTDGVPVQAESYPTGGNGRVQNSPQGIAVDPGGRFVFAANNESNSIAVLAVLADGTLETVGGSPFVVGEAPLTYSPVYLAPTPDASLLYAAAQGALVAFEVSDDGALDPIQSLPETMAEIATSPAGDFLFAAGLYTAAVHAYRITATGMLEEINGSPFAYDASRPFQVVVSANGLRLWILDLDTGIVAFDVDDDGALHLTGQTPVGTFAQALESAADDRFLYAAPPFKPEVRGYAAVGAAPVALSGSPYPAEYTGKELLASPDGSRLYQVTTELASILPMTIDAEGGLAPFVEPVAVETDDDTIPNGATYFARGVIEVAIDVRPGSDRNPIQLRGRGVISVAILGTDGFDVADVDQASVRFGPAAAIPAHRLPHRLADIDGDGDSDVVLHFRTEATGITCGDTSVSLTGLTYGGREFAASDGVDILGCHTRSPRSTGSNGTRPQR
jgi:6-phosphogluconolactonase (cycloisomerase 2 family)